MQFIHVNVMRINIQFTNRTQQTRGSISVYQLHSHKLRWMKQGRRATERNSTDVCKFHCHILRTREIYIRILEWNWKRMYCESTVAMRSVGSVIESNKHLSISIRSDVRYLCEPSNRRGQEYIRYRSRSSEDDSVSKLVRIPTEVWEVVNSCLYWLVALSETQRFRSLAQTEFLAVVRLTAFMMLLSQAMLASSM